MLLIGGNFAFPTRRVNEESRIGFRGDGKPRRQCSRRHRAIHQRSCERLALRGLCSRFTKSMCAPISNSHRACLRTQLTWHAPSQAEFGFPFWSSDEREIRAWCLSREHAQMRRLSEEQRKGTPGAADGKRKVKTSLCDRAEAEATAQQLARDEGHGAQQCLERSAAAARALEASFATRLVVDGRPSLATAVDAVESTDTDTSQQSRGLTQTGLSPSAAPPSTHIWSSRFRKSWNTAPAVASAPVAKPTLAKRKPPVAKEPAATADVDRHSRLPDGWVCRVHEKSA